MSTRITSKNCEEQVARLARIMGRPVHAYNRMPDGSYRANTGALKLHSYQGYYRVVEITGEGGGESDFFGSTGLKAGDFYTAMNWVMEAIRVNRKG
jgi:hypothetical protein